MILQTREQKYVHVKTHDDYLVAKEERSTTGGLNDDALKH